MHSTLDNCDTTPRTTLASTRKSNVVTFAYLLDFRCALRVAEQSIKQRGEGNVLIQTRTLGIPTLQVVIRGLGLRRRGNSCDSFTVARLFGFDERDDFLRIVRLDGRQ
jgi:hypothetical protein